MIKDQDDGEYLVLFNAEMEILHALIGCLQRENCIFGNELNQLKRKLTETEIKLAETEIKLAAAENIKLAIKETDMEQLLAETEFNNDIDFCLSLGFMSL